MGNWGAPPEAPPIGQASASPVATPRTSDPPSQDVASTQRRREYDSKIGKCMQRGWPYALKVESIPVAGRVTNQSTILIHIGTHELLFSWPPWPGGGDSHMEQTRTLVGNFEFNP